MTKKPSLYVVERREVVILVVLFVLVTILAFTMGVKYGQNLGRRETKEAHVAAAEAINESSSAGGLLGAENSASHEGTPINHVATADGGHAENKEGHGVKTEAATAEHGAHASQNPTKTESHNEEDHGKSSAHETSEAGKPAGASEKSVANQSVEKGAKPRGVEEGQQSSVAATDEYLLKALKEAGIERRQPAKEDGNSDEEEASASLPSEVKKAKQNAMEVDAPYFTIQVSSHTTEAEAKKHQGQLLAEKLSPMILSSVDSDGAKRYRVAIGKYSERSRALDAAKNYKSKGLIENYFVRKVH